MVKQVWYMANLASRPRSIFGHGHGQAAMSQWMHKYHHCYVYIIYRYYMHNIAQLLIFVDYISKLYQTIYIILLMSPL